MTATALANPTRKDYIFVGWDRDFTNVQSDLTVKAVYERQTDLEQAETIR